MADGGRCLSDLPDDLLRHILFFAPAKEGAGAAKAVLSRRWRWLWRTSGAVNLHSRSLKHPRSSHAPFLCGAKKALATAKDAIRRLTLFVGSDINLTPRCRRRREDGSVSSSDHNLIEALVSNPAARCVEELQIEVEDDTPPCTLSFCPLPSEALQVLPIVNCDTLTAAPPASFPCLADLHLHGCNVSVEDLRSTIAAAPKLSTLHLESCYLYSVPDKSPRHDYGEEQRCRRFDIDLVSVCCTIVFRVVTTLVFANCRFGFAYGRHGTSRLEISLQVPRLQYFRYEGSVVELTCRLRLNRYSWNNMIQQVDLCLTYGRHDPHPGHPICELFWRFVQSFNTTRRLKLKLDMDLLTDDLFLADKAMRDVLLCNFSFCRLEQLEIEAKYEATTSMVLLADLLHCCPMVADLRLKFSKAEIRLAPMRSSVDKEEVDDGILDDMLEHLDPSVGRLINRGKKNLNKVAGAHAKDIKLQHDDNYQVYSILGFTNEHAFSCLQSHLKRVSLDIRMDEPTSLGVKLAKFFAENAIVLQEMHVGECGQEMLEHLDPRVRRLITVKKKLDKVGRLAKY